MFNVTQKKTIHFLEKITTSCGPIGWASYHFVNESEVYINWWEFRQHLRRRI